MHTQLLPDQLSRLSLHNVGPFTLQLVLEDRSCLRFLKKFCLESDLSAEILLAYLDIQCFNQLGDDEPRSILASRIAETYLVGDAPMLISIVGGLRQTVLSRVNCQEGPPADVFREVSELLRQTLLYDIFPRFVTSRYFEKMVNLKMREKVAISIDDLELYRFLGAGGFGMVLLGKVKRTGQYCAVKVIDKQVALAEDQVTSVFREKEVLALVDHPFIISLKYTLQTDDYLCLVMDFVPGGNMYCDLQACGPYSLPKATFYAAQIVLALECLHSLSIIYRDLKPDNILLTGTGYLKLADMGASRGTAVDGMIVGGMSDSSHKTGNERRRRMTITGTHGYRAPEVYERRYGPASDWWGLGILIIEMLTLENPMRGKCRGESEYLTKHKSIRLPTYMSETTSSIVTGLLDREAENRLGSQREREDGTLETASEAVEPIKRHPFFSNIEWQLLLEAKLIPPFASWNPKAEDLLEPGCTPRSIESFCDIVNYLKQAKENRITHHSYISAKSAMFATFDCISSKVMKEHLETLAGSLGGLTGGSNKLWKKRSVHWTESALQVHVDNNELP